MAIDLLGVVPMASSQWIFWVCLQYYVFGVRSDVLLITYMFLLCSFCVCAAESLGIKETVPPYLDPQLTFRDLLTGVSFGSAGSGYDNLTAMAVVRHQGFLITF